MANSAHATTLPQQCRVRKPRTPPRWSVEAAKRVGVRPMTVEKRVQLGIHEEVAHYIIAARAFGDPQVSAKIEQPIRVALDSGPLLPMVEALRIAQRADAAEEVAETSYLTEPSVDNWKRFEAALLEQVATTVQLIRSGRAEYA